MSERPPRDEEGARRFLLYLHETGLDDDVRAICRAHHTLPRDVYLDAKGPTITAARVEAWWWLMTVARKSTAEVGRIFDREPTSVYYAMRKLGEKAVELGLELSGGTVRAVARAYAEGAHENLRRAGARARRSVRST